MSEHADLEAKLKPIREAWFRRYRRSPKPGHGKLVVVWAHTRDQGPDFYTCWGAGIAKPDTHLINGAFCAPRLRFGNADEPTLVFGKSIAEELIDRGYDITTLRFSIEKLPQPESGR